jgi:hypothetical protein
MWARSSTARELGKGRAAEMPRLKLVDGLVVDVALDNATDSYSSKPPHVSPEFDTASHSQED